MHIVQILLLTFVLLAAFPLGFLLAKATKEELKVGRRAFVSILLASIAVIVVSLFLGFSDEDKLFLVLSMLFIALISYISFKESYKKEKITSKRRIKNMRAKRK